MERRYFGRVSKIIRYEAPVVGFELSGSVGLFAAHVAAYPIVGSQAFGVEERRDFLRGLGACTVIDDAHFETPSSLYLCLADLCPGAASYLAEMFEVVDEEHIEASAGIAASFAKFMPTRIAETLSQKWLSSAGFRGNVRRLRWYGLSKRESQERAKGRLSENAYGLGGPTQRVDDVHPAQRADAMRYASLLLQGVRAAEADGHSALSIADAHAYALRSALVDHGRDGLALALTEGLLLSKNGFLARPERVDMEIGIVRHLRRLQRSRLPSLPLPERSRLAGIDDHQWRALQTIVRNGVTLVSGRAGAGKTRLIQYLAEVTGPNIMLSAPTNRAARRLESITGVPAMTLHRLLRSSYSVDVDDYIFDRRDLVAPRVLVVDEARLVSPAVYYALLKLVSDGTRVVFLGDTAQLPTVDAGDVFANLLALSGLPTAELLGQHRAGEALYDLACAIREGRQPPHEGWGLIPFAMQEAIAARYARLLTEGYEPKDIMVLSPTKGGPTGTTALNEILSLMGNPNRAAGTCDRFVVGDRVIAAKHEEATEIATGDLSTVVEVGSDRIVLLGDDGFTYERTLSMMERFAPAWALSVYASQGHEAGAVTLALGPSRLAHRETLFTAVTRAQQALTIASHPETLERAILTEAVRRNTVLNTFATLTPAA